MSTPRRNQPAPSDLPVRPDKYFIACLYAKIVRRKALLLAQVHPESDPSNTGGARREISAHADLDDYQHLNDRRRDKADMAAAPAGQNRQVVRQPGETGSLFAQAFTDAPEAPAPAHGAGETGNSIHRGTADIAGATATAPDHSIDRQAPRTSRPEPAVAPLQSRTEGPRELENEARPQGHGYRADRSAGESDQLR